MPRVFAKSYGQTWIRITIFKINWLRTISRQAIDSKRTQISNLMRSGQLEHRRIGCTRYHTNVKKIVYLSLGSNLGDRQSNLRNATGRLLELGDVLEVSSLYETEPVEVTDQPWFLNCTVAVRTELIPREFLAGILEIERSMGRRRIQPKGPRIIDIDILLFGPAHINTPTLDGATPGDRRAEICVGTSGRNRARC